MSGLRGGGYPSTQFCQEGITLRHSFVRVVRRGVYASFDTVLSGLGGGGFMLHSTQFCQGCEEGGLCFIRHSFVRVVRRGVYASFDTVLSGL
jgi:hypothetical protein